jgi:N-acetylglucosamine transport system substrate-binding protein
VRKVGDIMPIQGATEGIELPESLRSAVEAVQAAGREIFYMRYTDWYEQMEDEGENAMAALLYQNLSPEKFAERLEAAAERTRRDRGIRKYRRAFPL